MIFVLILAATLTHDAPTANSDALPFGLDKLHWGMTEREARRYYPALDGNEPEPGQPDAQLMQNEFPLAGCRFTLTLNFEQAALAQIELESEGSEHLQVCNGRIKKLLLHQYGGQPGGFSTAPNPRGFSEYAGWGSPTTAVTYGMLNNGFIEINFSRRDQVP